MFLYIKSRSITEEKYSRGIDQKLIQLVFKREKSSLWKCDPNESFIRRIVMNMQQTILWNITESR